MFWKFNLLTSHIDTLLDKEDLTLHEVLDEDDVLQECKAQNKRLLDFLIRPDNIEELVNFITQEPSDDTDEKIRYKYPNTACELLTSDVGLVTEKLAGDDITLNKVYGFLENEEPLNPLLASFFSKVIGLLITRKSEMMLDFLQSKEDFVGHLLRHLGTSAIMDLLLRLITCIESPECHIKCLNWLSEKQLIQKLVAMIDPVHPEEKHCNASQSLCDIIRLSREQMSQLQEKADPDPLLATMESQETIADLLSHMFDGNKVDSVLVNGILVLQHLLEFKRLGFFMFYSPDGGSEPITSLDAERLAHGVNNTVQGITPRLKDFHKILKDPPKQHYSPMPTTIGSLDPPFGNTRLQTTKLLAMLLSTKTEIVNAELANLGTLGVLLDLCFKYMWNNFLHSQVEQCIATILGGTSEEESSDKTENPLLSQLLTDLKIADRILEVWEDNDQQQTRPGGHRKGFMGHITNIANHVVTNMQKGSNADKLQGYFKELPEDVKERWETFVSGSLADVNKQNTVELAGGQNLYSSSEDDDPDFRDIPFPQDTAMQQAFSDYQLQQMTSNFIDQFGFNEEDFAEQDERASEKFKERISSINFDINTDEITNAATLFEQACNERVQQFDDQESEEDLWEEKEITYSQSSDSRQNSTTGVLPGRPSVPPLATHDSDEDSDSTDSEEELDSPARILQSAVPTSPQKIDADNTTAEKMEVDNSDNWANFDEINMETTPVVTESAPESWPEPTSSSPKGTSENWTDFNSESTKVPSSSNAENWADFSNIDESSTLNSTDPGPRSSSPVAMETNDSSSISRTAAYLVSSAPADLASEIQSSIPKQSSTTSVSASEQTSLPTTSTPDTTSDISSAPSSQHQNNPVDEASHPQDGSFLAASGLMKCADDKSGRTSTEAVHNEVLTNTVSVTSDGPEGKIEEIRAQAKEALDQYTAATTGSSSTDAASPSQNGPV